jgi:hypothetical protein
MSLYVLAKIRCFSFRRFTVLVDAVEETDLDLSWDEDGTIEEGLYSGEFVAFCARVRVLLDGNELGTSYLGNCIYRSYEDFKESDYMRDMLRDAIREARKHFFDSLPLPYVRKEGCK